MGSEVRRSEVTHPAPNTALTFQRCAEQWWVVSPPVCQWPQSGSPADDPRPGRQVTASFEWLKVVKLQKMV